MYGDRPYWNMDIEPFLNTPAMKDLQLEKLKIMLKRYLTHSSFHRKRMNDVGLTLDNVDAKVKSLEDFSKIVPMYTKETFRLHSQAQGGNMVRLMEDEMPVGVEDLILVNSTTGTTGEPTPYPLASKDVYDLWGETLCRVFWRGGARRDDRILQSFALSMVIAGTGTLMGLTRLGAMIIPVGAELGTERILSMVKYFKPTVFLGTPSLASYLLEKSEEKLGVPAKELGFKLLFCGGEPGAGVPELKETLEQGFGARLIDFGAALGGSCLHPEYQGMHFLGEDLCIYELVDPETKEPIPMEDGARGEAVFTIIEGDGLAWLRNSIGDIHEVTMSPCPCGNTGFRYKIVGRTDDMLKVKGVMVYPTQITGVVESFSPRVSGQYRIVLTQKPPMVVPPLEIKIERAPDFPPDKLPELEKEMLHEFHSRVKITPKIIWQEPGELERSTYKGQKFEKLYDQ